MPPRKKRDARAVQEMQGATGRDPIFVPPPSWVSIPREKIDAYVQNYNVEQVMRPGDRLAQPEDVAAFRVHLKADLIARLPWIEGMRLGRLHHCRHMMGTPRATDSEKAQWLAEGFINEQGHVLRDNGSGYDPVQPEQSRPIPAPNVEQFDLVQVDHGTLLDAEARDRERSLREAASRPAALFDGYALDHSARPLRPDDDRPTHAGG